MHADAKAMSLDDITQGSECRWEKRVQALSPGPEHGNVRW